MTIFEELVRLRDARLRVEKSLLKSALLEASAHELHTLSADELWQLEHIYSDLDDLHEMMFLWLNKNKSWGGTEQAGAADRGGTAVALEASGNE
jgi:hypothetical protein